jgi:uncharacterized Zn finger protein
MAGSAMQFQCYYCGGTTYRVLREPKTVECLKCGRSSKLGKPEFFSCPKCGAQSFMVIPDSDPMKVECLRCGTVAPFTVRVSEAVKGEN